MARTLGEQGGRFGAALGGQQTMSVVAARTMIGCNRFILEAAAEPVFAYPAPPAWKQAGSKVSCLLKYPRDLFYQFAGVEGIGKHGKRPDHGANGRKKSRQEQHQTNQVTHGDAAHHRIG